MPVEIDGGFIKNGPKCGKRGCGGKDWIIKSSDKVKCSKHGHTRKVEGLKAYVVDGPKCGTRGCGGTDWFIGKNKWVCAKHGHTR